MALSTKKCPANPVNAIRHFYGTAPDSLYARLAIPAPDSSDII